MDNIEDMLLSRQPENLDNYTFAAIFVDKVYADPQKAKKRKKMIIIAIVVLLAIVIAVCVCCFLIQRKKRQIADMNYYFTNTVEYINTGNFIRAQEECGKSEVLAEKVRDNDMRDKLQEYLFVIETTILADENYSKGEYESARNYYINAMDRARYADRIGESYMEQKLEKIEDFLSVMDFITLGDSLLENAEYEKAEEKYLQAKKLASAAHYTEGKEKAMEALEKLYAEWSEAEEQKKQAASEQAEKETVAAELIASGDRACLEQDFAGAKVYYTMAMVKYQELEDAANQEYVQQKINSVDSKIAERNEKIERAASLEQQGAHAWSWGDYWSAESLYLQAKGLYLELGNSTDVERIANVVAQIDALIEQSQDVDG